jgi:hypothetical protein
VNTIHRSEQLFGQLKKLPSAGRKMLDAFVSGWMRFAVSAASTAAGNNLKSHSETAPMFTPERPE